MSVTLQDPRIQKIFQLVSSLTGLADRGNRDELDNILDGLTALVKERTELNAAKQKSEERFSTIFHSSPIGMSVMRLSDRVIVDVNEAALNILGMKREEVVGFSPDHLSTWGGPDNRAALNQELRARGQVDNWSMRFQLKSGEQREGLLSLRHIDLNGEACLLALHHDVTEIKRTEEALRASENRLSLVFNNTSDLQALLAVEPDGRLRMLSVNQAYLSTARAYGLELSADDLIGKYREEVLNSVIHLPPADYAEETAAYARAVRSREPVEIEQVIHAPGGAFHAQVRIVPVLDRDGVVRHVLWSSRDITERKRAETVLREKYEENQQLLTYLKTLHEISVELTPIGTLDEFYKKVVESGLKRLGFDRMGFFLYDVERNIAIGTYGTDAQGNLQSESHIQFALQPHGNMWKALQSPDRFVYEESGVLHHNLAVVGTGWRACAALWRGDHNLGWLVVDNLVHQQPVSPIQLEILAQYSVYVAAALARRQAEAALRQSEQMLQNVINTIPVRVFWKDKNSRILGCNQLFANDAGIGSPDELIRKNDDALLNAGQCPLPDMTDKYLADDRRVMETGSAIIGYEEQVVRPGGNISWLRTSKVPLRDPEGQIIGVLGTYEDITSQKEAREALQRSNQRLAILREIDHQILLAHNQQLLANGVLARLTQLIPCEWASIVLYNEDLTQEHVFAFQQAVLTDSALSEFMPVIYNDVLETLKQGQTAIAADLAVNIDTRSHLAQKLNKHGMRGAMATPLITQNRLYGALALASSQTGFFTEEHRQIAEDIATQVSIGLHQASLQEKIAHHNMELEQRVQERTEELRRANEEIKNFAYIVSHDLRSPLVNLRGFSAELRNALRVVESVFAEVEHNLSDTKAQMLRETLQSDIPESLGFIESSVNHMDTFTKAILRLSRLGRSNLELVEVNAREIVDKMLARLAYQIHERHIKVTVGDLPTLQADRLSLEQIFGNILSNAIAYLDPSRPGEITLSGKVTDQETIFQIGDNGRGIAPEDMDKIFAPFRRAGKQDVPGEGMGLAYVQALVSRHGGQISCESQPGAGTVFTFSISRHLADDGI
jgi:PAS domain S-box-containing protein